jgi:hypothetical protein
LEVFAGIDHVTLREAITQFIKTDRGSFFPAPGQVMGIVEQLIGARPKEITWEEIERMEQYLEELKSKG